MFVIYGEKVVLSVVEILYVYLCIEYIFILYNIDNVCNFFGMEKKIMV